MRFIAAAILFAMSGTAQQPPDPGDSASYRIEGTVVDDETGHAIEKARVEVSAPGEGWRRTTAGETVSGDGGHFSIPLNNRGPFWIRTSLQGYMPEGFDRFSECSPCTVTVRLRALANFSGRVVSADTKEPLLRVTVEALRTTYSPNLLTFVPSAATRTGQDGKFALALPPGQYFFRFTPADVAGSLLGIDPKDGSVPEYVRQFWPGGDDYRSASPFTVAGGTDFRMPDVWMEALPRFQISGTVAANMCTGGDAYTIAIDTRRGTAFAPFRTTLVHCGAEYVFADLAPGRYQISLLPKDGGEALRREEVVVTDSNLQRNFGN